MIDFDQLVKDVQNFGETGSSPITDEEARRMNASSMLFGGPPSPPLTNWQPTEGDLEQALDQLGPG